MPILLDKGKCTGCAACFNKCPQKCIQMVQNKFGFLYPEIDSSSCIDCKLCEKVCPGLDLMGKSQKQKNPAFLWGGYSLDYNTIIKSTSGGVFIELCRAFYKKHPRGVVFGVSMDKNLQVVHDLATNLKECYKFCSSKYVQSEVRNTYINVDKILKNDGAVLFTGTPCQVAGLKAYLGVDYDNLYTQAIVCHGVPSGKLWDNYCGYLKKKYGKVLNVNFRAKKDGWENYTFEARLENGKLIYDNLFLKAFGGNIALRDSCSVCDFKYPNYDADLILGDFWHINSIEPRIYNKFGVSMVIGMTDKGSNLFEIAKQNMNGEYFPINYLFKSQKGIGQSVPKSSKHDLFLESITTENFESIVKKYTKLSMSRKVRAYLARWYRRALYQMKKLIR